MSTLTPPTTASNAELVRWVFDKLNLHELDPLVERFWTNETVERFPDRANHGAGEIRAYFEEKFTAMPDFHMEVIAVAEQGDDVFVHWRLAGTHEGPMSGVAATRKPLSIEGIDHFVIRDGRCQSGFISFDQMEFARQFGMIPPDGSLADKAAKAAFNAKTKTVGKIMP